MMIGSLGGTSVLPNFGFELTRTLLDSAVDALDGAAVASSPETVTSGTAVDVTVTTSSPLELAHPATTRQKQDSRATIAAVRPRSPPIGDRRTVMFPSRAWRLNRLALSSRILGFVLRTTVGRSREVLVTRMLRSAFSVQPDADQQWLRVHRHAEGGANPVPDLPGKGDQIGGAAAAVGQGQGVLARHRDPAAGTRVSLVEAGPLDQPGRRQLDRSPVDRVLPGDRVARIVHVRAQRGPNRSVHRRRLLGV